MKCVGQAGPLRGSCGQPTGVLYGDGTPHRGIAVAVLERPTSRRRSQRAGQLKFSLLIWWGRATNLCRKFRLRRCEPRKTPFGITKGTVWLGSVGFVVGLHVKAALGFLGEEIGADKRLEVTIENAVDVANFEFGAVVLDEPIGLHHIGTDLAAEGNVHLCFVEFVAFFAALLHFEIIEFRSQHFHSHFAVLVLAALHLTGDDDARGNVRDAVSGFDLVDVLSGLAAGTEGIELQVLGLDVHFDTVVNLRNHKNRGERSVTASGLIKGRNANEAMNTGFAREQPVSIFTAELNGGVLDAGFFARGLVENRGVEALTLSPAKIHAKED